MQKKTQLVILASGSGSNAEALVLHFKNHPSIKVAAVLCNKESAGVFERMKPHGIPCVFVPNSVWKDPNGPLPILEELQADFIILAGFLQKIQKNVIQKYPQHIFNIHPSLLPHFGGKGMYGSHVHKAVLEAKAPESGITIHLVNEHFDEGRPLFQSSIPIQPGETEESLAQRINQLEIQFYPVTVEKYIQNGH